VKNKSDSSSASAAQLPDHAKSTASGREDEKMEKKIKSRCH
jgi:hypothetical protein